ncbi:hypothetical protein [Microbacterium gorillae]|uniref:hypothetical protein n=1 Tax=Microbacterium gorillae TaxID=1231063 RepID=UPI00058F441F|nr:hypothetical protein [Microbacterium gorillae]
MARFTRTLPVLIGLAVLTLTGCTAPSAEPTESAAAPTEAPSATPTEEPVAEGRTVPAQCASLDLAPGAHFAGATLGECVAVALSSYGSGRMMLDDDLSGTVDFTYAPDYAFQGTVTGPSGEARVVYVGGKMWMDTGSGFVEGDPESSDPQVRMVGAVAALYAHFSDVRQTADFVRAQPGWSVAAERKPITLPGGTTVDAYEIVSDGAFTWNEVPVDEMVLRYGEDWVPVGVQATVSAFGSTVTQSQTFFDLGVPITITAPTAN